MKSSILVRFVLGLSLCAILSAPAFAQTYGGGTGGTGGTGTGGTYTAPKGGYSSSTGIGIGAAAAAGGVIAYLALRKASIVGCVEQATDGMKLMNEKDKKTYALDASGQSLTAGNKVQLSGKKSKDTAGNQVFHVKSFKDMGSCTPTQAQATTQ